MAIKKRALIFLVKMIFSGNIWEKLNNGSSQMPSNRDIVITPEMLNNIAEIDRFAASRAGGIGRPTAAELNVMRCVAMLPIVNNLYGNNPCVIFV